MWTSAGRYGPSDGESRATPRRLLALLAAQLRGQSSWEARVYGHMQDQPTPLHSHVVIIKAEGLHHLPHHSEAQVRLRRGSLKLLADAVSRQVATAEVIELLLDVLAMVGQHGTGL